MVDKNDKQCPNGDGVTFDAFGEGSGPTDLTYGEGPAPRSYEASQKRAAMTREMGAEHPA